LVIAVRVVGAGGRAQQVGPVLDYGEDVGDRGRGELAVPLVEDVDGAAEDDFLGVGDPRTADQGGQRDQQGQPPGPDLPPQLLGVRAGQPGQRGTEGPGVERVDLVEAAADADDLAAEVMD